MELILFKKFKINSIIDSRVIPIIPVAQDSRVVVFLYGKNWLKILEYEITKQNESREYTGTSVAQNPRVAEFQYAKNCVKILEIYFLTSSLK